ncbi:TonB-dependent receptor domain-containing protein [Horticoccus sp. 23ND18S-11]|uniref:TonB-dependent receptor domain-containing protein n=1 Tax=Horticoccus sp. 23ND18S-11 TaxID=3391832 RepID=UPI0039C955B2
MCSTSRFSPLLRNALRGALLLTASAISLSAQTAPTGIVEGRVLNATSGNYLNHACVVVKDTLLEAFTNESGAYRIAGVPAGTVNLTVSHAGLAALTKSAAVSPGSVARIDFDLVLADAAPDASGIVTLGAFTVQDRELTAQGAALNEQRNAPNIKNVVSIEEFGDLGITNPGHFLTYVPGVSNVYNTTGEVEGIGLRGMSSSGTVVMFDGAAAASNDPASRAYNFSGTSVVNLDRVEVTKVPTPDLPANAVGGSINLISKSGFIRRTPLFRYNGFVTVQAKGSHDNLPPLFSDYAGNDANTTRRPVQPGFDLGYILPVNPSLAFTFNVAYNGRYQDREYISPTWDRVRLVQTAGSLNSVINIFTKDIVALGADWKKGRSTLQARFDLTRQQAYTRQNIFSYNFGAGATGGETVTTGAATGVGSLGLNAGQNLSQFRRMLNARVKQSYAGDVWQLDWNASFSRTYRRISDVDRGFFGTVATTLSNVVVSAQGLDGISSMTMPQLSVRSRTGALIDPYDVRQYTLNTAASARSSFNNTVAGASANAARTFAAWLPVTLKVGTAVERTQRDVWTESLSWNFRPPGVNGQLVGSNDFIADAYSARRTFNGGLQLKWLSAAKVYDVYRQHADWFQLNETSAHTGRVNSSKRIDETISSAYVRSDVKALNNRLWLVAGVRFEQTLDEGFGPLNDIRNTYVKDAAGNVVLGSNGRPVPVTTDPVALAKLQFKERAAFSEKKYHGYYPSVNASYTLAESFVLRAAYAGTIGRPDLNFITPGTSISDPAVAPRTVTVVNTGLQPWTADNFDLTLESYEFKGATVSVSGFRKEMSKFFTSVQVPATPALVEQYGLPDDILSNDYLIITQTNSPARAVIQGLEWNWRQSFRPLTALPGWARSLGVFLNRTDLSIGGAGASSFSGYSTRITNYGISYARPRFAIKVNATSSNGPRNAIVAANATTPAGTFTSLAPRTLVGGSAEYRINKRVTVHLSGQNLSNALYRNMTYSPGAPAYVQPTQYRDNGIEYVLGLKGEF